jgi:hypothetical protein
MDDTRLEAHLIMNERLTTTLLALPLCWSDSALAEPTGTLDSKRDRPTAGCLTIRLPETGVEQ